MKKRLAYTLVVVVAFYGCQNSGADQSTVTQKNQQEPNEKGVSTESIQNPKTASEEEVDTSQLPEIRFANKEHDFGTIKEGETVSHTFKLTNTGESKLIISNADASCGCTVPHYPKEPIPPGESRNVKVSFNSKGKQGQQRKSVKITANTQPNIHKIYITANVKKADE